jgi:hypothetical protein
MKSNSQETPLNYLDLKLNPFTNIKPHFNITEKYLMLIHILPIPFLDFVNIFMKNNSHETPLNYLDLKLNPFTTIKPYLKIKENY